MATSSKINTNSISDNLDTILSSVMQILESTKVIPQLDDNSISASMELCSKIPEQIQTGRLKIAVVGVIKSGKSTFVNSFLEKESVKRGAGVMTSVTTRIRKADKKRAHLFFKSWDEINSHLQDVLELFPHELLADTDVKDLNTRMFDIRRTKDREYLEQVYQTMHGEFSNLPDRKGPEAFLFHHALKGFKTCQDMVGADEVCHTLEASDFDSHKLYTADPDKAFYIKDVCLELPTEVMDSNIELADCQGADSTDPAQLEHVLDYLESSSLIVYCISSRTGLRQADTELLNRIQRLGLLDNILFINNCDLSEHEDLGDLVKIEQGIVKDLEFLNITPMVFSFSSLYSLFSSLAKTLKNKDKARLKLWQSDKEMVEYCENKQHEFYSVFTGLLDNERHTLLISNHLGRIKTIIFELDEKIDIFLDLLSSDQLKEKQALEALEELYQNASRLETIVSNSLDSAVKELKDRTSEELTRFFKHDKAGILTNTLEFVESFSTDIEKYRPVVKESGFKQILYMIFQDFKRRVELYGIEYVQPELKKCVIEHENKIDSFFRSLFDSYQIDLINSDKYSQLNQQFDREKISSGRTGFIDFHNIKKMTGIQIPGKLFKPTYSSALKARVLSGFWFQTLSGIFSSIVKQEKGFSFSPALKKTVLDIKQENKKLFSDQFVRFGNKLYLSYFSPLINAAIRDFEDKVQQRFNRYLSFKQDAQKLFALNEEDKKNKRQAALQIKQQIKGVSQNIDHISS